MNNDPLERQKATLQQSEQHFCVTLPPNISEILCRDPRLIGFIAARHKLVAKVLEGRDVLEIGCQDGFGTMFVAPYVRSLTCIDFYEPFVEGFKKYTLPFVANASVHLADITAHPISGDFDGAFALDVLEHIDTDQESRFWINLSASLKDNGIAIVGMPSLESQVYASEGSKIGHVNCKTGADLKSQALKYFSTVIVLSMNDEMLHNGYLPMSHYIIVICSGKINLSV